MTAGGRVRLVGGGQRRPVSQRQHRHRQAEGRQEGECRLQGEGLGYEEHNCHRQAEGHQEGECRLQGEGGSGEHNRQRQAEEQLKGSKFDGPR